MDVPADTITVQRLDAAGLATLLAPTPAHTTPRVVALFATWCAPCEVELAQLTRLGPATGAEVVVVSVDPLGTDVGAWLRAHGVRATAYHLPEDEAAAAILAVAPDWPRHLPASFVVARAGRPLRRFDGVAPAGALEALLR